MGLHEVGEIAIQRACGGIEDLVIKICAVAGVVFRQPHKGAAAEKAVHFDHGVEAVVICDADGVAAVGGDAFGVVKHFVKGADDDLVVRV